MPLLSGDRIESYELVCKCGRGAFGEVWIANDPIHRKVALKIIDKFSRARDELKGLMTYCEMPPDPHLISIYHIGETEEFYYYTMELADNASDDPDDYVPLTLETVLNKKGAFSAGETFELARKLLAGVSALHRIGLVHRYLKPSNIIYVNGEPKISDVGLVVKANVPATLMGSIGFITPERIAGSGKKVYSAGDDLYALGKILYCYWTGKPPEEYPSLPAKCFASPQDAALNNVLKRACSNNPEKRFQDDRGFSEFMASSLQNPARKSRLRRLHKREIVLLVITLALAVYYACWHHLTYVKQEEPAPVKKQLDEVWLKEHQHDYLVIDLSAGPRKGNYPVRWSATPPDLTRPLCRMDELWLKRIPAGSFMMGSPESEAHRNSNETLHKVDIQHDFYMGIFEVTQMQYWNVMGENNSRNKGDYRPVEWVEYRMIRGSAQGGWPQDGHHIGGDSFLARLQRKTGLLFDLPTEAEWEYACRAGTTGPIYLEGIENLDPDSWDYACALAKIARYDGNRQEAKGYYKKHTSVGSYLPNAWGLYDMQGNVWEYCLDWYEDNPVALPGLTPKGPEKSPKGERVVRGGDWLSVVGHCRAALRRSTKPVVAHNTGGFRIVYPSDLPDIVLP